jgi:hypothetical protein
MSYTKITYSVVLFTIVWNILTPSIKMCGEIIMLNLMS